MLDVPHPLKHTMVQPVILVPPLGDFLYPYWSMLFTSRKSRLIKGPNVQPN